MAPTSGLPQTDKEWDDLASSTLTSVQAQISSSPPQYEVAQPGTTAFAKTVDHTLLKLDADEEGIKKICEEARTHGFKAVCIRSNFVRKAKEALNGSDNVVCSVVCFPEGTQSTEEKITESTSAVNDGASELDFVIDAALLKQRACDDILQELQALRSAFGQQVIKLILETSQLTDADVVLGCLLASAADFDFVKTSTGFLGHGATEPHVRIMRVVAAREGKGMQVKASGGIRSAETAKTMLQAGATRLGLSGSIAIMSEGARA